ncbi:MAG: zinc-ribbon domain-containing protein [Enterococcus sp.]
MKICQSCGEKINEEVKFCQNCGQIIQVSTIEGKKDFTSEGKEKMTNLAKSVKTRLKDVKESKDSSFFKNKKNLSIFILIILVIGGAFGWHRYATKDFREAYSNGEYLFKEGKYGEAYTYFEKAYNLDPQNEDASHMKDYSQELGNTWIAINSNEFDSAMNTYELINQKAESIKEKEVKKAYEETVKGIENTSSYQIEKQVYDKYNQ